MRATLQAMGLAQLGYWDFFEDADGYWRWRFTCSELQRVVSSDKRHASSAECVDDAMEHGYTRMCTHRVTRAFG